MANFTKQSKNRLAAEINRTAKDVFECAAKIDKDENKAEDDR